MGETSGRGGGEDGEDGGGGGGGGVGDEGGGGGGGEMVEGEPRLASSLPLVGKGSRGARRSSHGNGQKWQQLAYLLSEKFPDIMNNQNVFR